MSRAKKTRAPVPPKKLTRPDYGPDTPIHRLMWHKFNKNPEFGKPWAHSARDLKLMYHAYCIGWRSGVKNHEKVK